MTENQEIITSEKCGVQHIGYGVNKFNNMSIKCAHVTEVSVGQLISTVEPRLYDDVSTYFHKSSSA